MNDFVNAFPFIAHHTGFLWDSIVETLKLFAAGFGLALVIAVPLGVWLGHLHRGQFLAINLSNIGRALPSLAIISILVGVFGLGFLNVTIALVILAVPVML